MTTIFQLESDAASGIAPPPERDTMSQYLRERYGLHECWRVVRWLRGMGDNDELPDGMVRATGGVYYAKKSGKNKGRPNYNKPVDGTVRTLFFTTAEHDAWKNERDSRGICKECNGTGKRWVGWCHESGNKYETCRRCSGTGNPANKVMN